MSEPFIGEIKMFSYNWAPKNWAICDGALLQIMQNQALYSLIGTTFGGDGTTNFKLPDMRGRVPLHSHGVYPQGTSLGEETVILSLQEMAAHTHAYNVQPNEGDKGVGSTTTVLAKGKLVGDELIAAYASPENLVTMIIDSTSNVGGGQPHSNMQPIEVVNFCIAMQGLYPPRN